MQLFQLTGLVNKPLNKRQDTALAEALRRAVEAKRQPKAFASMAEKRRFDRAIALKASRN